MKKHGIAIDCANCQFIASHSTGDFAVSVPVTDEASELAGQATLHCRVSSQAHDVELAKLHFPEASMAATDRELDRRLTGALEFVAEKRLCGNRSLCPTEVVELVEKATRTDKP